MYEITTELRQLILYKYPRYEHLIGLAKQYLNQSQDFKNICIHGFFGSGKTAILMIIRLILEFYNIPVVAITLLNSHANSIEFKTIYGLFNINWITCEPTQIDKYLYDARSYILIDDAFVGDTKVYENLDSFLRLKLKSNEPWGGRRVIVNTTTPISKVITSNDTWFNKASTVHSVAFTNTLTCNWLKSFKLIEILQGTSTTTKSIIGYAKKIHQYQIYLNQRQLTTNTNKIHNPPSKRGFARLNAGLIITWNTARVNHFNTLCQMINSKKNTIHTLQAWRNDRKKTATKNKCNFVPICTKVSDATTNKNIIVDRNLKEVAETHLCTGDKIMITQATKQLKKGVTGTYKHPYQIKINNRIFPITKVKQMRSHIEYKFYPIQLAYATTLNRVFGEKFTSLQIDICNNLLEVSELCASISRVKKIDSINFIINDTEAIS